MKDWQPIFIQGAILVRGRLFCYLGGTAFVRMRGQGAQTAMSSRGWGEGKRQRV